MRRNLNRSCILTVFLFLLSFGCFYVFQIRLNANLVPYTKLVNYEMTESAVGLSTGRKYVTKSLSELGKTPELSKHILFFNRVPKSGSEILVLLLQHLQGVNNFRHVRLRGGSKKLLSLHEQEHLVDEVTKVIRDKAIPLSFDRHVFFVNFTSFGRQSPTYINLIRDPVDKFLSSFYYRHVTSNPRNSKLELSHKKYLKEKIFTKNIERCVKQKEEECVFKNGSSYELTIPFFCGHDPRCMIFNSDWALETAKSNADRYFSVVGILEELNSTLQVFEKSLPYFFAGIQSTYLEKLFQSHHNINKFQVKPQIRSYFKQIFVCEYNFYEWVKTKLFKQLQMLYGH